jgi:hypothetical protein
MKVDQLREGVLVSLKMGRWNASVKIDPEKLPKHLADEIPKQIWRTMQDMVKDKSILTEMTSIRNRAKYVLQCNALMFPIDNVWFVPKDRIQYLDDHFTKYQKRYHELTDELCKKYKKLKSEFKEEYPVFFKIIENKYPSIDQLKGKFYFTWNFFQFTIPDEDLDILPPSVYEREKEKFKNMVKEMEQMTVNMVGQMLFDRVKKLEEQCDSGSINKATVNGVENFLSKWEDLWSGHVDESKMKSIVKSLKHQMKKNGNADVLKENDAVRAELGKRLGKIIGRLDNVPNLQLKRRLDI